MDIANAILRCRRARQLRQADVASRAGISEAYLSLLERGLRTDPSLTILAGIAEALEVPLPVLVAIAIEDDPDATAEEPALSDLTTAASHLIGKVS
jgi:transcriptional regulator with XRE-family HTH domain